MTITVLQRKILLIAIGCMLLSLPAVAQEDLRFLIDWQRKRLTVTASTVVPDETRNSPAAPQRTVRQLEQNIPDFLIRGLQSIPIADGKLVSDAPLLMNRLLTEIDSIQKTGIFEYSRVSPDRRSVSIQRHYSIVDIIQPRYIQHDVQQAVPRKLGWTPSADYTGIVIYASHLDLQAALLPKIYSQDGQIIFHSGMSSPERLQNEGLVLFASNPESIDVQSRVGLNPKRITAVRARSNESADLILHTDDVHTLLRSPSLIHALQTGRVAIILSDNYLSVHY